MNLGRLVQSPVNSDWLMPAGWEQILGSQIAYHLGGSVLHLWRVQFHRHATRSAPLHAHPCSQLLYYQHAGGTLEVDGHRYEIRPGTVFFVPSGREHRFLDHACEPAVCLAIDFTIDPGRGSLHGETLPMHSEAAILLSLLFAQPARPFPLHPADQSAIEQCLMELIRENERRELGYGALIQALLLRLIALCLRGTERADGFHAHFRHTAWRHRAIAERVQALATGHAARQPGLSLQETARLCGVSANHLGRILRSTTGRSFREILLAARLSKARDLLENGRMNCTEVALESGFNDPNYFARAFRKAFGHPPSHLMVQRSSPSGA